MTRPNLNEIVGLIRELCQDFPRIYLIIDALDEANEEIRSELVAELLRLKSELRFLCTSRFLEDIRDIFSNNPRIEIYAHKDDVQQYLTAHVMKEGSLKHHVDAEPRLLGEIVEIILAKTEGM